MEYASGGYIEGSPVPIVISPDECFISYANVKAGRYACDRPGHPTPSSACRTRGTAIASTTDQADDDAD